MEKLKAFVSKYKKHILIGLGILGGVLLYLKTRKSKTKKL